MAAEAEIVSQQRPWIGPNGEVMQRLELHLTYTCPEKCLFCSEEHRMNRYRKFPITWGRVAKVLRMHAERGVRNVHLTGGEPTIHPRFIQVLKLAKKLGMRTSIGTIGTRLCKPDFAQKALPYLDEALFSIHSHIPEEHNRLTQREGSFKRVVSALENCVSIKPGFGAYVNIVLTKINQESITETVDFVVRKGARLVVISNTTPEGAGEDSYSELAPSLIDLRRILQQVPARSKGVPVRFFGVPMCVLGPYATWSNDLHWDPRVTVEWASEPGKVVFDGIYSWTPARRRVHAPECQSCSRNTVCMGIFDQYVKLWPTSALKPYCAS